MQALKHFECSGTKALYTKQPAYPLLRASVKLCGKLWPVVGIWLHRKDNRLFICFLLN